MESALISATEIAGFQRDGACVLRGPFADWVDVMAAGVARNIAEPGQTTVMEWQWGAGA